MFFSETGEAASPKTLAREAHHLPRPRAGSRCSFGPSRGRQRPHLQTPYEPWLNDTLLDIKPARVGDSLPRAGGWGRWWVEKADAPEGICSFRLVPSGPAEETRPLQGSPARAKSHVVPGHGTKQASTHARPPASRAHVKVARAASGRVKATIVRRPSRGLPEPTCPVL